MRDDMDVNAGEILDGKAGIPGKGEEIYRRLIAMASGERTRSEILGHREFAPWRIGPCHVAPAKVKHSLASLAQVLIQNSGFRIQRVTAPL